MAPVGISQVNLFVQTRSFRLKTKSPTPGPCPEEWEPPPPKNAEWGIPIYLCTAPHPGSDPKILGSRPIRGMPPAGAGRAGTYLSVPVARSCTVDERTRTKGNGVPRAKLSSIEMEI